MSNGLTQTGIDFDLSVIVRVEIDKSGYDPLTPSVDFLGSCAGEVRGDFNDLPTSDSDISISTGGAGSIKDPTVANENIVGLHLSIGPAQPQ